jgi:hypothetical protein
VRERSSSSSSTNGLGLLMSVVWPGEELLQLYLAEVRKITVKAA